MAPVVEAGKGHIATGAVVRDVASLVAEHGRVKATAEQNLQSGLSRTSRLAQHCKAALPREPCLALRRRPCFAFRVVHVRQGQEFDLDHRSGSSLTAHRVDERLKDFRRVP